MPDRDDAKPKPVLTPRTAAARAAREARLAEALRENLKRRKAQARGRADDPGSDEPERADKDK